LRALKRVARPLGWQIDGDLVITPPPSELEPIELGHSRDMLIPPPVSDHGDFTVQGSADLVITPLPEDDDLLITPPDQPGATGPLPQGGAAARWQSRDHAATAGYIDWSGARITCAQRCG
jgi:hypothetical protein